MKGSSLLTRWIIIGFILLFFLLPPLWIFSNALKSVDEIFAWPPSLLPEKVTLENFIDVFENTNFVHALGNSFFVSLFSSLLSVTISVMAGYALAKFRFRGDTLVFMIIMCALMIPLQIILIPIFLLLRDLHLLNTLWGVIIAPAATPTGVFLMRQYIKNIPDSLLEAARLEGTGEWRILWRIIVPLSLPAIATLTAFTFVWRWNDFLWPFLVISDQSQWTVQLALASNVGQFDINWPRLLAMSAMAVLPMLAIFLALQRYFMNGMMAGATKE